MEERNTPREMISEIAKHVRTTHLAMLLVCAATYLTLATRSSSDLTIEIETAYQISQEWRELIDQWRRHSQKWLLDHDEKYPENLPSGSLFISPDDAADINRGSWLQLLYPVVTTCGPAKYFGQARLRFPDTEKQPTTLDDMARAWDSVSSCSSLRITAKIQDLNIEDVEGRRVSVSLRTSPGKEHARNLDWMETEKCSDELRQSASYRDFASGLNRRPVCALVNGYMISLTVDSVSLIAPDDFVHWLADRKNLMLPATGDKTFDNVFPRLSASTVHKRTSPCQNW